MQTMPSQQFRELIETHLLPMFPGSHVPEVQESGGGQLVAWARGRCDVAMRPSSLSDYRIIIRRSQEFTDDERGLLDAFARKVSEFDAFSDSPFLKDVLANVPRHVVATVAGWPAGESAVRGIIEALERLSSQTYEGHAITISVGVTGSVFSDLPKFIDLVESDFARVLSNGYDTLFRCDQNGRVFNLETLDSGDVKPFAPYRHGPLAKWAIHDEGRKVALALNRNGEILVFAQGRLQFAKRRGRWTYYPHEAIVPRIRFGQPRLKRAVYESCLDVSFARTGACICILPSGHISDRRMDEYLDRRYMIGEVADDKAKFLKRVVGHEFSKIDRRIRLELLAMDGAMILDNQGGVVTAGAIVKVEGVSSGGARTAAATRLSKLGFGIKVSEDGPIIGYRNEEEVFRV